MKIVIRPPLTKEECDKRGRILGLQEAIDCMLPTQSIVDIIHYVRKETGLGLRLAKDIVSTRKQTGEWIAPLVLLPRDYEWSEVALSVIGGGHLYDEFDQRILAREDSTATWHFTQQSFRIVRKS